MQKSDVCEVEGECGIGGLIGGIVTFCFNTSMASVLFKIGSLFKCVLDFIIFAYSIVFF